ncbi:DUF4271 domain-containing protein [Algoriphagus sp. AK58]|uniref:DUF4271 domain-containing protein n=1 Tax=Algoriphagus sp. AK58 TaxID=1406877 RepID=UPI00164FB558|nr:DUF4271 domain-containing protein [Algoriphagus sp. AK58]
MLRLILIFFFLTAATLGYSQVLENYDQEWTTSETKSFASRKEQYNLNLNIATFPESSVRFEIPAQSTIFLEGKLWRLFQKDTIFSVPLADLKHEFGKDTVEVTLVNDQIRSRSLPLKITKVMNAGREDISSVVKASQSGEVSRFIPQPIEDFYFTSLVGILFLLAIYRMAYPYLLGVLLQPLAVINAEDFSESGSLQKFFSFDILFYLLIVGMMISQIAVTGILIFRRDWLEGWIGWEYSSLILLWLAGAFLILVLTILKFIAIRIISYLFDLGKSEFAHFFYLLRLIVFGFSIMILVGSYFVVNNFSGLTTVFEGMVSGFFWFYVIGVSGLFLIMVNRLSFKKYHLFTYLCIAEMVPFLILSKWIMVLVQ